MQRGTFDQRARSTQLNIQNCTGLPIINDFGTLRCPRQRDVSSAPDLPEGTYKKTCFGCSVRDLHLHCKQCILDDGTPVPSSVSMEGCSAFGLSETTESLYCEKPSVRHDEL